MHLLIQLYQYFLDQFYPSFTMNLITIKTFNDGISSHIVKARLESEGIQCFVYDENIVTLNPLYNIAVGGVKLKINEEDRERALTVLRSIDETPLTNEQEEIIKCPNCHSTELYSGFKSMKNPAGIVAAITSFVFSVFPIYFKTVYRCKKCDTEFNQKK